MGGDAGKHFCCLRILSPPTLFSVHSGQQISYFVAIGALGTYLTNLLHRICCIQICQIKFIFFADAERKFVGSSLKCFCCSFAFVTLPQTIYAWNITPGIEGAVFAGGYPFIILVFPSCACFTTWGADIDGEFPSWTLLAFAVPSRCEISRLAFGTRSLAGERLC